MPCLIHIESSPRKEKSISSQIAAAFIKEYKNSHPDDELKHIDLWNLDMPDLDDKLISAHRATIKGKAVDSTSLKLWKKTEKLIMDFKSADKYLFSVPMWNFSIPYKLKHYLDLIVQEKYTYDFKDGHFQGLITGRPAVMIYARADIYEESEDMQKNYMEKILRFIGFENFISIFVEPNSHGEDFRQKAILLAKNIAKDF